MKWSNVVVIVSLIALVGYLGNGVISCSSVTLRANEARPPYGEAESARIIYRGWFKGWQVFVQPSNGNWPYYQNLNGWLDKNYEYVIDRDYLKLEEQP